MESSRTHSLWFAWRLLVAVILASTGLLPLSLPAGGQLAAQAGAEPFSTPGPAMDPALVDKAQRSGKLGIIVALNTASVPEGQLANEADVAVQRSQIARAQDAFLAGLAGYSMEYLKRYESIPALAFWTDAAGLKAVMASPGTASVMEDISMRPSLDDSVPLVQADDAQNLGFTGTGQAIAILDTGVDKTHPFLAGKVVSEACFSVTIPLVGASLCPNGSSTQIGNGAGVNCPLTVAGCDHGTHVAGIAAGAFNTSPTLPSRGVAPDARIISIQVFHREDDNASLNRFPCRDAGDSSPCVRSFPSDQLSAFDRLNTLRSTFSIASVNMSLGGGQFTAACDLESAPLKLAVDNLRSFNIMTVVAAGNSALRNALSFPGCISTVISVGNTTKADIVSTSSNVASFMTLFAPGTSILSSVPGGGARSKTGTSMATPHVAGAVAILKDAVPGITANQIVNALASSGPLIRDQRIGGAVSKRRLDVRAALGVLGFNDSDDFRSLQRGVALAGTISPANDTDVYFFSGLSGERITLRMNHTSTSSLDPFVTLVRPNGNTLASDDNSGTTNNALLDILLPDNGVYRIRAASSGRTSSGDYSLSASTSGASGNPAPRIRNISPTATSFGQSPLGFSLNVFGFNFINGSVVRWNGQDRPTIFWNSTQLQALIPPTDILFEGTAGITVFNPAPAGGTSNGVAFTINPTPIGTSHMTPETITLTPGVTTTLVLSWTHPLRWRLLDHLDVRLHNRQDQVPFWLRFNEGVTCTVGMINESEELIGLGLPGEQRVISDDQAFLDLSQTRFKGTGPTGPGLTVTMTMGLKPGVTPGPYEVELLLRGDDGVEQGPDIVARAVVPTKVYIPLMLH